MLYDPFPRKLAFGAMRTMRPRWGRYNLLGVTTIAWALVVGLTGAMNELASPLFALWQHTDVAAMVVLWKDKIQRVVPGAGGLRHRATRASQHDGGQRHLSRRPARVGAPYLLFTKGRTPLTSRLFSPVLVDARTSKLTAVVGMLWYLHALELSRPLHFGDYGGLPLKIIWTLLDLVTIAVLVSGLYLWIAKRKRSQPNWRDDGNASHLDVDERTAAQD